MISDSPAYQIVCSLRRVVHHVDSQLGAAFFRRCIPSTEEQGKGQQFTPHLPTREEEEKVQKLLLFDRDGLNESKHKGRSTHLPLKESQGFDDRKLAELAADLHTMAEVGK